MIVLKSTQQHSSAVWNSLGILLSDSRSSRMIPGDFQRLSENDDFVVIPFALRVLPAVTRLTVYRWLLVPAQNTLPEPPAQTNVGFLMRVLDFLRIPLE